MKGRPPGITKEMTAMHTLRALLGVTLLAAGLPALADVVSVKDFGAVGDGATDDTAAIQAALDAVAARGGGTVLLPAGTFVVSPSGTTKWLRVGSETTVQGAGDTATTVKVRDGAGDYRTVFGQASPSAVVRDVRFSALRIDQNAAGNLAADVRAGDAGRAQNAIAFTAFDGVTVEGVAIDPATGVNTISLNGVEASGAVVRGCRIRFVRARSLAPSGRYDNSAVYVHGARFVVSGNRFANGGEPGDAIGAIEVHGGPGGVVSGNQIAGYFTGVQVVSEGATEPEVGANDLAVVGNAITGAGAGIQLWALTGRALRNVTVTGNVISVGSPWLPGAAYAGIALRNEAVSRQVLGDHDGISITGNTVTMARDPGAGYAWSETGGIMAVPQGSVRNLVVAGNVVRDAPSQGIRIESKSGTVAGLVVRANVIVDAGNDPSAGPYRIALILAGRITGGQVKGNVLVDTGTPPNGAIGLYAASVAAGSEVQLEGNAVSVADPRATLAFVPGESVYAERRVTLAWGPLVSVDATLGRTFTVTATDRAPFSIAPAAGGVPGQRIAIHVRNASGGPLGAVTWLPGYRLAGRWIPPAHGYGRLIELEWDGASWIEVSRSAGDVPN